MGDLAVVLTAKADRANGFPSPVIEDITNRIFDLKFSTTLGTGFLGCEFSLLLPKWKAYEWYERFAFYGIDIYEADEHVWQGRIHDILIQDFGVTIECEGYWASMVDQSLYAFWADNDMSKWKTPTPGAALFDSAAGILGEMNMVGLGRGMKDIDVQTSENLILFGFTTGQFYSTGSIAAVYYRLARAGDLIDNRIFSPNTIHSISYTYDRGASALAADIEMGIWTANHARGNWSQRVSILDTDRGKPKFKNIAQDGERIEAVAVAAQVLSPGFTQGTDGRVYFFNDITIFSERDAILDITRKGTSKKIFTDLLKGNDSLLTPTHAKQLSEDTLFVEDSDSDIIPAAFENVTMQDIIINMHNFGLVDDINIVHNPVLDINTFDWNLDPAVTGERIEDTPDSRFGEWSYKLSIPNTANKGVGLLHIAIIGATPFFIALKPVEAGEVYIQSIYAKLLSGSISYRLQIQWQDKDEVLISTSSSSTFTVTTTWQRFNFNATAPAGTVGVRLRIEMPAASGANTIFVTAAQFEKSVGGVTTPSDFVQGDMEGVAWGGKPHDAKTIKTTPVVAGVYGRNRFVAKRRDETAVQWIIPLKEVQEGGIQLQKSALEFWGRAWTKFTEGLTGLTKFASSRVERVEQYYDSFQIDTSGDYDFTSQGGGDAFVWSQEPTVSRVFATGMTHGVQVYNGGTVLDGQSALSLKDVDIEAEIVDADDAGLVGRFQSSTLYYYLRISTDTGLHPTENFRIFIQNGGHTALAAGVNVVFPAEAPGHHVRFRIKGDLLEGYLDGVLVTSVTDTTISAAGKCGFRNSGGGSNISDIRTFGITSLVDLPKTLAEELFHDERDIIMEAGQTLEGFARLIAHVQLIDSNRPKQSSELVINGSVMNSLGVREALWRVRAGDIIRIPDLIPFSQSVQAAVSKKILDKLTVFVVKDTEYEASTNTLKIVPDAPIPELDLVLARAAGGSSVAPVGGVGSQGGNTGAFGGIGSGGIPGGQF